MPSEPAFDSEIRTVVGDADTMKAMGTGDVDVLALPRIAELAGRAAEVAAARSGVASPLVVSSVVVDYPNPVPVGAEVAMRVTLAAATTGHFVYRFVAEHVRRPPAEALVAAAGTIDLHGVAGAAHTT